MIWIGVAILAFSLAALGIISKIENKVGVKEDNAVEEWVEDQIEKKSGLKIDLTPESPEKK